MEDLNTNNVTLYGIIQISGFFGTRCLFRKSGARRTSCPPPIGVEGRLRRASSPHALRLLDSRFRGNDARQLRCAALGCHHSRGRGRREAFTRHSQRLIGVIEHAGIQYDLVIPLRPSINGIVTVGDCQDTGAKPVGTARRPAGRGQPEPGCRVGKRQDG